MASAAPLATSKVANNSGFHEQIDTSIWQQDFSTSKALHQIHAASLHRQIDGTAGHTINSRQLACIGKSVG
jgi:hypothetical protein